MVDNKKNNNYKKKFNKFNYNKNKNNKFKKNYNNNIKPYVYDSKKNRFENFQRDRKEFVIALNKYKFRKEKIWIKNDRWPIDRWEFVKKSFPWHIRHRFFAILSQEHKRIKFIRSYHYNWLLSKRFKVNILKRRNKLIRMYWLKYRNWYDLWTYNSTYLRYDYYMSRKKQLVSTGLPQLVRFFRYNKNRLYNNNSFFNNNLKFNNLILNKSKTLLYMKKVSIPSLYKRFEHTRKWIVSLNALYYFWVWRLLSFSNNYSSNFNAKDNLNLTLNNKFLGVNKFLFEKNSLFLNKVYYTSYKDFYLELLRNKRNLEFKINKKVKNKLFRKKLFWKYYKNIFFSKRRFKKTWNNTGYPYTLKNIGLVNINISLNNTFITLTDLNGNVLYNAWAGILGIKGPKRSTPTASEAIAKKVSLIAQEKGIKYIYIKLNGVLYTRKMKSAIKGFVSSTNLKVLKVLNITPKPHNGIRKRKIKKI